MIHMWGAVDGNPGIAPAMPIASPSAACAVKHRIEARVEAFNAFNWLQKGNPVTNLSSSSFGRIQTLGGDMRVMQFAFKYIF